MYSVYRNCTSPLKRTVQLGLFNTQRSLATPLILQTLQYSQSHGSGGKDILDKGSKSKGSDGVKSPKSKGSDAAGNGSDAAGKGSDAAGKGTSEKKLKAVAGPPKIELRIIPAMYHNMGYEEKNMKLGRQLAPHLSIYKIQLTSVMSIMLRGTGFLMAIGIWIIGLSGYCCDLNLNAMAQKIEEFELSKTIFKILKFCIILPFAYHAVAGTRHLIWYLNVFLSKPEIYATGYVAIALTLMLATGLSLFNLENDEEKASNVAYEGQMEMKLQNLVNETGASEIDEDTMINQNEIKAELIAKPVEISSEDKKM